MDMNFPSQALPEAQRNAAYRRLAAVVLGLDVATLAAELRAARVQLDESEPLAA